MNDYIVRLSNVIAWLGLVYFAGVITHSAVTGIEIPCEEGNAETLTTFVTWLLYQSILFIPYTILSILNYLMVGKLRLLPWIGLMVKKDNDI